MQDDIHRPRRWAAAATYICWRRAPACAINTRRYLILIRVLQSRDRICVVPRDESMTTYAGAGEEEEMVVDVQRSS